MLLAGNKADIAPEHNLHALRSLVGYEMVPTSAEYELALRRAAKASLLDYLPGASSFALRDAGRLSDAQRRALEKVEGFLRKFGSTGVQECIDRVVFTLLDRIVVYPVEDETHWTDKHGNVLPDALLVPRGSTAKNLAGRVHTDFAKNFIRAIDGRSKMVVGADSVLRSGDIVKIVARV